MMDIPHDPDDPKEKIRHAIENPRLPADVHDLDEARERKAKDEPNEAEDAADEHGVPEYILRAARGIDRAEKARAAKAEADQAKAKQQQSKEDRRRATDKKVYEAKEAAEELLKYSGLDFEVRLKAKAAELGVAKAALLKEVVLLRDGYRAADAMVVLPEVEPWPGEVDGASLLTDLVAAIESYVILPSGAAIAVALWLLFAHAHDAFQISPILAIQSPTHRCGKSTLLNVLQPLVPRALPAANTSTAALFRAVDAWSPSLLIDEADSFALDNNELRGVLNSGHNRANAYVLRCDGDDNEPKRFTTWAPKAIALIGTLQRTLQDRSIVLRLKRKLKTEQVKQLRLDRVGDLEVLNRQAARWTADNLDVLRDLDPEMPTDLNDRAADNWRPLMAIAARAGGGWTDKAWRAARLLSGGETEKASKGVMLLEDIRKILLGRDLDKISSADLVAALIAIEDASWGDHKRGKAITQNGVARELEEFRIFPGSVRIGQNTPKGYKRTQFEDAWQRYCPPSDLADPPAEAPHRHTATETGKNDEFEI